MIDSAPARPADGRTRAPAPTARAAERAVGVTIYGCGQDEAVLVREMAPRIGVVPRITEAAASERNAGLAAGNRCISVGHKNRIANTTLHALSEAGVRYISTRSSGHNHIDVSYARSVGISVGNVTYSPHSVADYTLMLMLMLVRHAKSVFKRAEAHDYRLPDVRGKELRDLTIGVIGPGRIGSAVIDRLRGFGCQPLSCDTRPATARDTVSLGVLLARSDIVTLHAPLSAETHHLLDRDRIRQMRRDAMIVNTGRGALLDTEALVRALETGRLAGAALDVLEGEEGIFYTDCSARPIESDLLLRLHDLPNVLISPHTAYYTEHALRDIVEQSLTNCLSFAGGEHRG